LVFIGIVFGIVYMYVEMITSNYSYKRNAPKPDRKYIDILYKPNVPGKIDAVAENGVFDSEINHQYMDLLEEYDDPKAGIMVARVML
jgi:hypothetical protein